ncbi:MAG TPA: ABC transporter permease [Fibrobacteraceae bacterium]|nr:ABC transporter permease [Fibrobacteraceae bacterium]
MSAVCVQSNLRKPSRILAWLAMAFCALVVLMGVFSDHLSPYTYNIPSGKSLEAPSWQHWLGTDDLGMDLWALMCHGARTSLLVGVSTALLAGLGGGLLGSFSAYLGGWPDRILMRLTDLVIAMPRTPTLVVLATFWGPSLRNIILVLAFFSWCGPARVLRSRVLALQEEKFIVAARSFGARFFHLARRHFLPNLFPLFMIGVTSQISRAIMAEAGLAFLGLGDPLSKSWGLILNSAMSFRGIHYTPFWKWWVTVPLFATAFLVAACAILCRELETRLDTKGWNRGKKAPGGNHAH